MKKQSLQEQLLNAGLVSTAKAKTVKTEKHKLAVQQRKNKVEIVDEAKLLAEDARIRQAERDRELNVLRMQEAEKKQIAYQIKQLIEINRLPKNADGQPYQFNDCGKVKTVYIDNAMRTKIAAGRLAIVAFENGYEVVAVPVADKIRQRAPEKIVVWFEAETTDTGLDHDAYQGYEIPDDLIW